MKTVEAVYEQGVFRPLESLTLPEGTRVSVPLPLEAQAVLPGSEAPRPDEDGDEETHRRNQAFAAKLAEIAALPMEGKDDGFSGRDHDEVLYGWKRSA